MHLAKPDPRNRKKLFGRPILLLAAVPLLLAGATPVSRTSSAPPVAISSSGEALTPIATAVVNVTDLATAARAVAGSTPPVRVLYREEILEDPAEPPPPATNGARLETPTAAPRVGPFVASPAPTLSYQGLDDIPMADSSYIVIPPDVGGAVGPSKVMCGFNNNYRIQDKATGATLLTVGTATFWNPVISNKALLNQLTDPRTVYDPIQNRWIVAMQTVNTNGLILFGVSFTSDPAGSWYLYAVQLSTATGSYLIDFPTLGFNKNWICVSINRYTTAGAFNRGNQVVADYSAARNGTLGFVTLFDPGLGAGTRFCASPCVTISATEDTLFLPTHLSSGGASYQVDVITGTPGAPVYTSGAVQVRPGGGWTQPSGNQLPQSAPNAGASACGVTPCPIEAQDAQIRSAPTYRLDSTTGKAYLYYTQSIRITTPVIRNLVQWTKLTPGGGGTNPVFADGGRIDDPTGANFYSFPHIAVNKVGDFIVGYSRFGSGMHPSAAYSMHLAVDGLGTMRDPFTYKAGDDYYHKTFTTTTGRNRWGDFSTCQVDPCDDQTLWALQEYAKPRTATNNDGNTGSNSSRWSSYWAAIGASCDGTTPTLVSRFDATVEGAGVDLTWWSDAVGTIEAWNVYRAPAENGPWTLVNASPIPMRDAGEYRLHDAAAIAGKSFYRLGAIVNGQEQVLSNLRISSAGEAFSFTVVGGNPFASSTKLRYAIPKAGHVRVDVYSISGERVRTLVDRSETAGVHMVDFTLEGGGRALAPGIYMARITAGTDQKSLRLIGVR
jgi:hypothetical protein